MLLSTELRQMIRTLFGEIAFGSPNTDAQTFMLNRGDVGLVGSLEQVSAEGASASVSDGGTIAAHVEHLRYGLSLMNRWASGERNPWKSADWTKAWKLTSVTDAEWRSLRTELRAEAERWAEKISQLGEVSDFEATWIMGTVAHTAYHVGAIRQIDRAARGPTAESEAALRQA